jgi:hypothetical protein
MAPSPPAPFPLERGRGITGKARLPAEAALGQDVIGVDGGQVTEEVLAVARSENLLLLRQRPQPLRVHPSQRADLSKAVELGKGELRRRLELGDLQLDSLEASPRAFAGPVLQEEPLCLLEERRGAIDRGSNGKGIPLTPRSPLPNFGRGGGRLTRGKSPSPAVRERGIEGVRGRY